MPTFASAVCLGLFFAAPAAPGAGEQRPPDVAGSRDRPVAVDDATGTEEDGTGIDRAVGRPPEVIRHVKQDYLSLHLRMAGPKRAAFLRQWNRWQQARVNKSLKQPAARTRAGFAFRSEADKQKFLESRKRLHNQYALAWDLPPVAPGITEVGDLVHFHQGHYRDNGFDRHSTRVLRVISGTEVAVEHMRNDQRETYLLRGVSTEGMVDGQPYAPPGAWRVTGREVYTAPDGTSSSLLVLEEFPIKSHVP
jgi:hypothetical protein